MHQTTDVSTWLTQCAQQAQPEALLTFIREVQSKVTTQVLPTYHQACRVIADSYNKGAVTRSGHVRRKLALSQEDIFLYQQARSERAQSQQVLQVLVSALKTARVLYNQTKCSRRHPSDGSELALLLLSFARRIPRQALRLQPHEARRLRSTLHFSFESLTATHATVASALLSQYPNLFSDTPMMQRNEEAAPSVELDRLRRKIVSSVVLSPAERAALDKVFSQAISLRA